MESQSIGPMSAVTFDEAMAKLIGYEGTAVPEELIRPLDKQSWTDESTRALSDLNHKLEFCSIEDALLVRIECLKDCLSEQTDELATEDENDEDVDEDIRHSIEAINEALDGLQIFSEAFEKERRVRPEFIQLAKSPTGIKRYRAHSVASWAREKFNAPINEWYDISKYNLYADELPKWIEAEQEQRNAHFDVLDGLLRAALSIGDLSGTDRCPPKWRGCHKKNGAINPSGIYQLIDYQFFRLDSSSEDCLPKKDVFYDRFKPWRKYYLSGLYSRRPVYTDETIDYTRIIIAGLLIGIANDSYGKELLLCKVADEDWPIPETTIESIAKSIQRISPETTKEIIHRSIGQLMRTIRDLD